MDKKQAYEYFFAHLKKWEKFLSESIDSLGYKEDDDIGETVKKERQRSVLKDIMVGAVANPYLLDSFIYPEGQNKIARYGDIRHFILPNLDSAQKEAVNKAVKTDTICFIQGPPGTGKTTVISEICLQLLKANLKLRILICSETHVAVDNIIEKFYKIEKDGLAKNLKYIRAFAKEKAGTVPVEKATLDYQKKDYYEKLYRSCIEDNIVEDLIDLFEESDVAFTKELMLNTDYIGVTCNSLAKINFKSTETFDYVIFDEVCKATLPEILIPLAISKRAIFVGDPKQLPPVFCKRMKKL